MIATILKMRLLRFTESKFLSQVTGLDSTLSWDCKLSQCDAKP